MSMGQKLSKKASSIFTSYFASWILKDIKRECVAGLTTFLTMSYIVVVNPAILSQAGMPFSGVLTATVLICILLSLAMGFYAKLPIAVAPGMGVNAYFAFTVVLGMGVSWQRALGMVTWAGILFLIVSFTGLREKIAKAIPAQLRVASAIGIGAFIAFIGFKNVGLIVADADTFVKWGHFQFESAMALLGLAVMLVLVRKKNPLAFLIGIAVVTLAAVFFKKIEIPTSLIQAPDFKSTLFKADLRGALDWRYAPVILGILFTDLFDSISTFLAIGHSGKGVLLDRNGDPKNLRQGLQVDAMATFFSGLLGTSSGTPYLESAAGVEMGGKTGLTAVVVAILFIPCLFIAPIAGMVPAYATAPILILIGAQMFRSIFDLGFEGGLLKDFEDWIPVFLTIILIPLTFNITLGILIGFASHGFFYVLAGRIRDLSIGMRVLSLLSFFLLFFIF